VLSSVLRTKPGRGRPETALWRPATASAGGWMAASPSPTAHTTWADIVPDSFRFFFQFLPVLKHEWTSLRLRFGKRFFEEWSEGAQLAPDRPTVFERVRILDPKPDQALSAGALATVAKTFPTLQGATVAQHWAGMIDVTPDAVPVISPVDSVPGFFIATGFSGHGFGIGPGAGRLWRTWSAATRRSPTRRRSACRASPTDRRSRSRAGSEDETHARGDPGKIRRRGEPGRCHAADADGRRDDVLIRVKAVGFNPTDYQLRQNGHPSLTPPVVLGRDVAGVVEACGGNVRDLKPGDAVFANLVPRWLGGYAEYVAAPACYVALKPASLSFAEAASVPVAAMTALCALRRARPDPRKSLLIAGGAGGVGSWAIGLAKAFGITRIVTTAGSEASRGYIRDTLGIDAARIVDYRGRGRPIWRRRRSPPMAGCSRSRSTASAAR
jgi:hypothetical protein